ncbi:hypothetical protein AgCh_035875 [Apium graveolens]
MARLQQTQRKRVGSVPRLPVDVVAAIAAEVGVKNKIPEVQSKLTNANLIFLTTLDTRILLRMVNGFGRKVVSFLLDPSQILTLVKSTYVLFLSRGIQCDLQGKLHTFEADLPRKLNVLCGFFYYLKKVEDAIVLARAQQLRPNSGQQSISGCFRI